MPWYYAGREAKPVGPVTLEQFRALRLDGTIAPESYIIEYTGATGATLAWKRYQDVFPATAGLPPLPAPILPAPLVPPARTHPLFPSAAPATAPPAVFSGTVHFDPRSASRSTNAWCAWGFGLALAGFLFSLACGAGLLLAVPSLLMCAAGLAQVRKNPAQAGQGLAIAGLIVSSVALLVSLILIVCVDVPIIKSHELTVTEQTTNDTE